MMSAPDFNTVDTRAMMSYRFIHSNESWKFPQSIKFIINLQVLIQRLRVIFTEIESKNKFLRHQNSNFFVSDDAHFSFNHEVNLQTTRNCEVKKRKNS